MDNFDYNSIRARKARLGRVLGKLKVLLILAFVSLAISGSYLLWERVSLGYLLLGGAIIIMMILIWYQNDLIKIPLGTGDSINDLLSNNCLGLFGQNLTTQQMAEVLHKTRSGHFLAIRFGLISSLLVAIAKGLDSNPEAIFKTAKRIRQELKAEVISGGILSIAIIENHPESELILKKMKLELSDLYEGIDWYNHLHGLLKDSKKYQKDGGIARDLSFGYIPLLQRFGRNLSQQQISVKARMLQSAHRDIIDKMVQTFSGGGRQNIALVGPVGSGRTTIVQAFAERLLSAEGEISSSLRYRQIFMLDAGALISAAGGRGELEGLMMRIVSEAFSAKNIILYLDNAHLFFEEAVGSVDISNLLLPIIEAGRLRMILTLDEQKFLEISAKNSALANALNTITVEPAGETETMKIMEDQVPFIEYRHGSIISYWALKEAYRMSERYVHDLTQPGRALNLLEAAAGYAKEGELVTEETVQKVLEHSKGVKVQLADNDEDKQKLLNLETLIHQRMIDQEQAVKAVADALRRAAAKVRNDQRPIGTFLFLGPTGVGKTELAKAISEVYFNGEKNIIRLDLNEFVKADDVSRLIAEGAKDATSLTAQVMKQPFAVVLLDEIEKAHPQVLTTLLQMLDEGVLRDEKNREVSFRDTIVIATSNAGADKIREYLSSKKDLRALKDKLVNELIDTGQFKPEFLNRFDEICLFGPLSKENLLKVVGLMINDVNKTLAPQKISVELTSEAKTVLVEHGYDPLLGARPMRRIVQKTVENLVAKAVLSGEVGSGSDVKITADMVRGQLEE